MSIPLIASTPGLGRSFSALRATDVRTMLPVLVLNVVTQSVCVAGVNQLMSVRQPDPPHSIHVVLLAYYSVFLM